MDEWLRWYREAETAMLWAAERLSLAYANAMSWSRFSEVDEEFLQAYTRWKARLIAYNAYMDTQAVRSVG